MTSSLHCPPRLATPRNADRYSYGWRVANVARLLGRPFMPWQRLVADVALEVDPATGHLHYRTVVLVVPRQQGKSSLLQAVIVDRAVAGGADLSVLYTAQDRTEARRRLLTELHERTLARSPLRGHYRVRQTNGDESLRFPTGTTVGIVAPTKTSGHGQTLDLAVIDEAFAQTDLALPQAFGPAMVTRRDAQLWIVSVVGDGTDALLQHYQAQGEAALEDPSQRIAYLEWSALDGDVYDVEVWRSCMPALGLTVHADDVRADPTYGDPAEFARAYLCRRRPAPNVAAIDLERWADGAVDDLPLEAPVVLAVDVALDRTHASIAAAGRIGGRLGVELIDRRAGTAWVLDRLEALVGRHYPAAVIVDGSGPAGSLVVDLERRVRGLVVYNATEVARACGSFSDLVATGAVAHLAQPDVDDAVAGAAKLYLGDAFRWRRRYALVDLSPLYAVTLAARGVTTRPGAPVAAAAR